MFSRLLKFALITLGGLVLLVVAVSISLHVLISRQDHQFIKDQVAKRVAEATGYTLRIDGPLELPYTLRPTIVLHDVVLNARDTLDNDDLLSADSFRITVAILPLLENRLRIDDTTLTNAALRLEFDAAGQANWIPETPRDSRESDIVVDVHAISFEQLQIQLVDRRIDIEMGAQIEEFNARIAELRLDAPAEETFVDMELVAEFEDMPIRAEGRISARDNAFAGLELPVSLTGTILDMAFAIEGHIDRVVGAPIDEVGFFANLSLEGSNMAAFNEVTGLRLPPTDSFVIDGNVEGHPGSIVASDVDGVMKKDDLTFVGKGRIGQLTSFDELDIAATLVGTDVKSLPYLDDVELPATDSFEVSATVRGDWPTLTLDNVVSSATRDDITVTASGRLADASTFGGADLKIRLDGNDLNDLAVLFDAPSYGSRSYSWSGQVRGSWPHLSVENVEFRIERDDLKSRFTGSIRDVLQWTDMDLHVEVEGSNVAAIPEFEMLELPSTDEFTLDGRLEGDPDQMSARDMTLTARRGDHRLTATGAVANANTYSGIDISLSASGTDLYELNDLFAPDFPHTEAYEITSTLIGDLENLSARQLNLAGSVPGADLKLAGDVGKIIEVREVDVQGEITIRDTSEFGEWSGISLPQDMQIELSGHMAGTVPNFDLSDLTYRSGESEVHGDVTMNVGDKLSFSGAITSGRFDVRPFLVAAPDESSETREKTGDRFFSSEPFDFSFLDAADFDFSLDDLELVRTGEYTRVPEAHIIVKQGSLRIDPLEMTHEDARLSGRLSLDRSAEPVVAAQLSLENIDLSKFLEDVRLRDFYEGSFDFGVDVSTQGSSAAEMAANLDGELVMFISDASISGVDLPLRITDVLLGALPWLKKEEDVNINCAMSQMVSEDGVVDVRVLYLDSAQLRMLGGGSIDLRNETYDLRLAPRPRGSRIFAHNIDLLVTGSITDPEFSTTGAARTVATKYGKYVLLGPAGLLLPSGRSQKHPCAGSLQEYREKQEALEDEQ